MATTKPNIKTGSGFKKINVDDRELSLIQDNVDTALSNLQNAILGSPVYLENIAVVTGNNVINHGLGRKPRGYWVIQCTPVSATPTFTDKLRTESKPTQSFTLISTAAASISLLII